MRLLIAANNNKTTLSLLLISLFVSFFFARSITVRQQWIVPTFMSYENYYQRHRDVTAFHLGFVNNWLQAGAVKLNLGLYMHPASVEMPTLARRSFYASYPPGLIIPIYLLFKALDVTGVFPDIYERRGVQLLLVTLYNYVMHFLLALTLCFLMFGICLRLGFDRLNSLFLAITPAIVQFHNANSLYHHHAFYNMEIAIMLPFALYVLLEFLRTASPSPRVMQTCKVLQPLLMFYGVLTDWLYVFLVATVYVIRRCRGGLALPVSTLALLQQIKQGFLFFAPALAALAGWVFQIAHYLQNVASADLTTATITAEQMTLSDKLVQRTGIADGIDSYLYYLKASFITHIKNGYGLSGLIIIFATFWLATRGKKFMKNLDNSINQAAVFYLMLLVPCIAHNLFFIAHSYEHIYSSIKFSLPLSFAFVLSPIFVLRLASKHHLLPALRLAPSGRNITWVTIVALSASSWYGYAQIQDKYPVTKMFAKPEYSFVLIGDFVKNHTDYQDVVFSDWHCTSSNHNTTRVHFTNKVIRCANNLDYVYQRTKNIKADFSIKILYSLANRQEAKRLTAFLSANNILVNDVQAENLGGLLSFNGKKFLSWYEHTHACRDNPHRCAAKL